MKNMITRRHLFGWVGSAAVAICGRGTGYPLFEVTPRFAHKEYLGVVTIARTVLHRMEGPYLPRWFAEERRRMLDVLESDMWPRDRGA